MDTSAKLLKARTAKGYSQGTFAELLGLSQGAYSNYENGREMKSGMIVKICAILECSPSWLLGIAETGDRLEDDSELLERLRESFQKLNDEGQIKVVDYADDLTANSKYVVKQKSKRLQCDTVSGVA